MINFLDYTLDTFAIEGRHHNFTLNKYLMLLCVDTNYTPALKRDINKLFIKYSPEISTKFSFIKANVTKMSNLFHINYEYEIAIKFYSLLVLMFSVGVDKNKIKIDDTTKLTFIDLNKFFEKHGDREISKSLRAVLVNKSNYIKFSNLYFTPDNLCNSLLCAVFREKKLFGFPCFALLTKTMITDSMSKDDLFIQFNDGEPIEDLESLRTSFKFMYNYIGSEKLDDKVTFDDDKYRKFLNSLSDSPFKGSLSKEGLTTYNLVEKVMATAGFTLEDICPESEADVFNALLLMRSKNNKLPSKMFYNEFGLWLSIVALVNKVRVIKNETVESILNSLDREVKLNNEIQKIKQTAKQQRKSYNKVEKVVDTEKLTKLSNNLRKEYHSKFKKQEKEITRLKKELEKYKKSNIVEEEVAVTELKPKDIEIDKSMYNLLIIGHPQCTTAISKLREIYGEVRLVDVDINKTLTQTSLKNIDFVIKQIDFVPHTANRFENVAKKCDKPMIYVNGTNASVWDKAIEDFIKARRSKIDKSLCRRELDTSC